MKSFPHTMTYSQPKSGSTTVMRAVDSAGVPCHRCFVGNVDEYHQRDMPTITMVRDPIARYVSMMFEQHLSGGMKPDQIPGMVMESGIKDSLKWFDQHYRPVTGINVYGIVFDKKKKWKIFSIRGLIIRTDALTDALATALAEFLPPYFPDADLSSLDIEHRAIGDDRFGKNYGKYKKKLKFPRKFLEEVYDTPYCKHFFYVKELKELINNWKE